MTLARSSGGSRESRSSSFNPGNLQERILSGSPGPGAYAAHVAAAPAGGFFTNRHMHAWGGITLGATLVIGAVPLGRTVSPHATPWWVPPGLVLGAVFLICGVLLFALPGIIGSLSPEYLAPSPASAPEFKDGDTKVKTLVAVMLVLYACGLGLVSMAPIYGQQ